MEPRMFDPMDTPARSGFVVWLLSRVKQRNDPFPEDSVVFRHACRVTLFGMTDPRPMILSSDASTRLILTQLVLCEDPRLNKATFQLDGPDVNARSSIDAYMIEDLALDLLGLVDGTESSAASIANELYFERLADGEIRVVLHGGGTYRNAERAWLCGFAAPDHAVRAFAEDLSNEIDKETGCGGPANSR